MRSIEKKIRLTDEKKGYVDDLILHFSFLELTV